DICMMYSVTDVSGINRISEKVLANAAHALAGMLAFSRPPSSAEGQGKPALGLTMFGLTTPCVQAVCKQLETDYDCLVFHATCTGTTAAEAARIGRFIVGKLNRIEGPVRFLIPEGGVSSLDRPGGPFWDPPANRALFDAISSNFRTGTKRKLLKVQAHINDQAFADALVANFNEIRTPWP